MRTPFYLMIVVSAGLLMQCRSSEPSTRPPLATPILPDTGLSALAVLPSTADASTGAARQSVGWGYRFVAGQRLHYRKTWVQQSLSAGDFHHLTEAKIEVESVDASGKATMVITIVEEIQQDNLENVGKPVAEIRGTKVYSSYAQSIPKLRVVVDRQGRFVSGEILQEAADHLAFLEEAKKPGVVTTSMSDQKRMEHQVEFWLPTLPVRTETRVGDHWIDTMVENRTTTRYQLGNDDADSGSARAGSTDKNEEANRRVTRHKSELRRFKEYQVKPLLQQGNETYIKVDGTETTEQDLREGMMFVSRSDTRRLFRASDGLPALEKRIGKSSLGDGRESYYEVVLELLPE